MFDINDSRVWLDYADRCYIATRLLWFTGFQFDAPVSAHRTIELYLKSYLTGQGVKIEKCSPAWGHKLIDLYNEAIKHGLNVNSEALERRIGFFEKYFYDVRYPGEQIIDGIIWFSFDSNISPLDEVVAFIRPRVRLNDDNWKATLIYSLIADRDRAQPHQLRALEDSNLLLHIINTEKTWQSYVEFNQQFNYDKPGC